MLNLSKDNETILSKVVDVLADTVSSIPQSKLCISDTPEKQARSIINIAAAKAAAVSGALALPPGPLGLITVIPDLAAVWRLQQVMVADIAAVYGKSSMLQKETMFYCLFKHGSAMLMRDLIVKVGGKLLVKRTSLRIMQQLLKRVGFNVTQKLLGKGISRWIPLIGAAGMATYSFYDTRQVGFTAIELFSAELDFKDDEVE